MTEPIRGKVARVLNDREIAINIGTTHGVDVGMYFDVMDAQGQDIKDPDTDEVLGSIERPRIRVRVTYVQDKLAVASTYKSKQINIGGVALYPALGYGPIARALMPPNWVTKYESLKKSGDAPDMLDEDNSSVKTGDPVVQVLEVDKTDKISAPTVQALEADKTEQAALTKNNEG